MDDDKTGPPPAALMSVNMPIETEERNYSWAEYEARLAEAGFRDLARTPIDSPATAEPAGHQPNVGSLGLMNRRRAPNWTINPNP